MTKKQIEKDMLRMFDTGSKKRNKLRWVEAEGRDTRRGRPERTTKKPRR